MNVFNHLDDILRSDIPISRDVVCNFHRRVGFFLLVQQTPTLLFIHLLVLVLTILIIRRQIIQIVVVVERIPLQFLVATVASLPQPQSRDNGCTTQEKQHERDTAGNHSVFHQFIAQFFCNVLQLNRTSVDDPKFVNKI